MNHLDKSILRILALLAITSLAACSRGDYWPQEPLTRINYAEYNLEEQLQIIESRDEDAIDFWTRMGEPNYLDAIELSDPIDVGLHFAGFPNIDGVNPDKVLAFYTTSVDAVVIVLSLNCMDDSIRDHEERIDLHFENNEWMVVWAGYRQRCRRSIYQGWSTGLCP
jgi:hypothetical protein